MILEQIEPHLENIRRFELKKGETLYRAGESPESIYFLTSGLIGLFHLSENGSETFLRVFVPGEMMGHRSFFAEENYHADAIALNHCQVVSISKDQCEHLCCHHPDILKQVTQQLAIDLRTAELRLSGLQDKTAGQRIAEALVYLKLRYPDQVWTRQQIAEYSCTTSETVTRVMGKLETLGAIEKEGRDFQILDQEKTLKFDSDQS